MKTISDIEDIIQFNVSKGLDESDVKKAKKYQREVAFLMELLRVAETFGEPYLIKELSRLKSIVDQKMARFPGWQKPWNVSDRNAKAFFKKESGIHDLEFKIKCLEYILEK